MEIIRQGRTKQKICDECGCVFKYTKKDMLISTLGVPKNTDSMQWFWIVYCPNCGEKIIIKKYK